MKIGNRMIGPGHPCFIVAELSANHNNSLDTVIKTVEAAKEAGADAIKVQTYTADTLTIDCDNEYFKIREEGPWKDKTLYELYQEASMPWEWTAEIKRYTEELGMEFFSTPFDETAVDFLEELGVVAYKVASFEIQHTSLIKYIASKRKPIIISAGIATTKDIYDVVVICEEVVNWEIALLACTSAYPAESKDTNLKFMQSIRETFSCVVGLSDHTIGPMVPCMAVAMGASIIEKHFKLDDRTITPDSHFSLDPLAFADMVHNIRNTEKIMGTGDYPGNTNKQFSRSIFAVQDIKKGDKLTHDSAKVIRPGYGLHPQNYYKIPDMIATEDIQRGDPLTEDNVTW